MYFLYFSGNLRVSEVGEKGKLDWVVGRLYEGLGLLFSFLRLSPLLGFTYLVKMCPIPKGVSPGLWTVPSIQHGTLENGEPLDFPCSAMTSNSSLIPMKNRKSFQGLTWSDYWFPLSPPFSILFPTHSLTTVGSLFHRQVRHSLRPHAWHPLG